MVTKRKIAVLGAGHGGRAMAAYLATIGCDTSLYNRTLENIHSIQQLGGIYLTYSPDLEEDIFPEGLKNLKPELRHEYRLSPVTEQLIEEDVKRVFGKISPISSEIEEVIKGREVIMVAVPATGHKYIAEKCAPYLKDDQVIILNPGRFFGAIEFYKTVNDYYTEKGEGPPKITVAEAQTFIYAARRYKPRSVKIYGVKRSVDLSTIPSSEAEKIVNKLGEVYPQFTPVDNVLKTSLSNLGGVFHVPLTILNATRIDKKQAFEYYVDGITDHTASIIEDVDRERIAVAEAMSVKVISARWWLNQAYGSEGADLYEAIVNTHAYKGIESPQSVNHRYIWEEVPSSLVPLSSLGEKLNVPTPMINSFIYQATALLREDLNINFFEKGRTMKQLGLADMTIDEIKEFVEEGTQ